VSAYREVTLYLNLTSPGVPQAGPPASPGLHCTAYFMPSPHPGPVLKFDEFDTGAATYVTKTYDPAPPNIQIACHNPTSSRIDASFMLAGRTG